MKIEKFRFEIESFSDEQAHLVGSCQTNIWHFFAFVSFFSLLLVNRKRKIERAKKKLLKEKTNNEKLLLNHIITKTLAIDEMKKKN